MPGPYQTELGKDQRVGSAQLSSSLAAPGRWINSARSSARLLADLVTRNLGLEHQTLAKPHVLPRSVVRRGTCFLLSFQGEDGSLGLMEVTAAAHLRELIHEDPLVQPHCLSSKWMGAQSRQLIL